MKNATNRSAMLDYTFFMNELMRNCKLLQSLVKENLFVSQILFERV